MKYAIALVGLAALAGCGSVAAEEPTPTVTATVTETAEPTPEKSFNSGGGYTDTLLTLAWARMTPDKQEGICTLYTNMPEYAWDVFSEDGSNGVTQEQFNDFFDRQC